MIFDQKSGQYNLYSLDKDSLVLPSYDIERNLNENDTLDQILRQCIVTYYPNNNFKLTDITVNENLNIYYLVFVTYDTTIKDGFLISSKDHINEIPKNAKKIISLL